MQAQDNRRSAEDQRGNGRGQKKDNWHGFQVHSPDYHAPSVGHWII